MVFETAPSTLLDQRLILSHSISPYLSVNTGLIRVYVFLSIVMTITLIRALYFTDRINAAGNAIGSVRPSVRLSVRPSLCFSELLHVSRS